VLLPKLRVPHLVHVPQLVRVLLPKLRVPQLVHVLQLVRVLLPKPVGRIEYINNVRVF
jgi:hypothetical protein